MSVDRDVAMARIIDGHYDNLRKLLREIEFITSTNVDEDGRKRFSDDEAKESQVVCPEVYKGSIHGYPFYTKGFETEDCSAKRDTKELVTLIFDEVVVTTATGVENNVFIQTSRVDQLLTFIESVYRLFPGIRVNILLGKNWNQRELQAIKDKTSQNNLPNKVSIYSLKNNGFNKGELLQSIINGIKTEYTLIAPRLTNFTNDINLERLIRILSTRKNTLFAGGSYRNLTGHWSHGCLQTQLKNYTLSYKSGYYHSFYECLVCDYISGPFLAKTSLLRDMGFRLSGELGIFRDLFLRVKDRYSSSHPGLDHGGTAVVTCPDVMFHTQYSPARDEELANFANEHNIKKIVEADGTIRWFGCRRGLKYRNGEKCPLKSGLAVPPCCLENIADAIKFVMEQCGRNNITCELQEGTLLGAVKLNKVLPWERDADITFLTADFPKLVKIKDVFTRQGYVIHDIQQPWCCVEGRKAGGKIELLADGWSIQMYGQHRMNSRGALAYEHSPTKVFFSGSWLNVPFNPGLYVRNRYGREVYQHAEHWLSTGKLSGWDAYEAGMFSSCPVKGFHGCLDQYQPDGSIQFENNF
ncbi:uncharacterized protein LOC110043858 [Orbicella faveolata]|uniref:uncharacterized protein LOC110043858 n=1 Tax=Orbicella faveolata TaxID=48498 RepID=UPI0009E62215|nr:uncharacterized protein LOC110043858 [Orbicella faveolata]